MPNISALKEILTRYSTWWPGSNWITWALCHSKLLGSTLWVRIWDSPEGLVIICLMLPSWKKVNIYAKKNYFQIVPSDSSSKTATESLTLSPTVWNGWLLKLSDWNPVCKWNIYVPDIYISLLHIGFELDNLSTLPLQTVGLKIALRVCAVCFIIS